MAKHELWIEPILNTDNGIMVLDWTFEMTCYRHDDFRKYLELERGFDKVQGKHMFIYVKRTPNLISKQFAVWYWRMRENGYFRKYRLD